MSNATTIHVFDQPGLLVRGDVAICGVSLGEIFDNDTSWMRLGEMSKGTECICPQCSEDPRIQMMLLAEAEL